jgi:hypothetical protein
MRQTLLTKEEDNLILEYISKYPSNISYALEQVSAELNVKFNVVKGRYYNHLRKNANAVLSTITSSGMYTLHNQKNSIRRPLENLSEDDQFEIVVKLIKKLRTENKKKIIEIIFNF